MGGVLFEWDGPAELVERLRGPFFQISVRRAPDAGIVALTLWRGASSGLQIGCTMHDLADGRAVGVLTLAAVERLEATDELHALPTVLTAGFSVAKLIGSYGDASTESGIVFEAGSLPKLIVATGAVPFTLTVSGLIAGEPFAPELGLDAYERAAL